MNVRSPISRTEWASSFFYAHKSTWLLGMLIAVSVVLGGCLTEDDLSLEQRSHQLASELMCPVCDGQTIDGSNAQISQDMRAKVDELLIAGNTNSEIKDYFVVRYGEEILAAPSRSGFNMLAWIAPIVIVVGALAIALWTIRNMRRSTDQLVASTAQSTQSIDQFLEQVDRDLGGSSPRSTDNTEETKD